MLKWLGTPSLLDGIVAAAGSLSLISSLAAQGGRWNVQLDLLAHLAPIWLIGSVLALAWAIGFSAPSTRPALLAIGLAGSVSAAALVAPEMLRPIRPMVASGAGPVLKVIQFNAWDESRNLKGSVDWIVGEKPDLVLMQEVTPRMRAALVDHGFSYTRTMGHTAVFSKAKPAAPAAFVPPYLWRRLPTFTRATFDFHGAPFSVLSVHLDRHTGDGAAVEVQALAELVSLYPSSSLIIGGDCNMTPWSFAMRRLDQALPLERRDRALPTWPARVPWRDGAPLPFPLLPIDHVYAGSAWRTVSLVRGPRLGSDHYPIVMSLALN